MSKVRWLKYLDPFFPYEKLIEYLNKKKCSNKYLNFIIFIIYSLVLAYIILKLLALILGGHQAAMIVVSGSMQDTLNIGDIVVLYGPKEIETTYVDLNKNIRNLPIRNYLEPIYENGAIVALNVSGQVVEPNRDADIIVYYSPLQKKEIIHRAILGIRALDGTFYITKGDNEKTNFILDADCNERFLTQKGATTINCLYPYALPKEDILAKHLFEIPYLGWIKLGPAYLLGWRPY